MLFIPYMTNRLNSSIMK